MSRSRPAPKRRDGGRAGRFYDTPDGASRPSVTNILSCVGKPALLHWMANKEREMVVEAAAGLYEDAPATPKMSRMGFITTLKSRLSQEKAGEKLKREAADIGSEVHALVERELRKALGQVVGPEVPISPQAAIAYAQWEAWSGLVDLQPRNIEETVWSSVYDYAGTLDMCCYFRVPEERESVKMAFSLPNDLSLEAFFQKHKGERVLAVADLKTSKSVYLEARLQVAAYGAALQEMGHGRPDMGMIIRLPKEEGQGFEVVPVLNMDEEFACFLHVYELWKRQQEYDKQTGWLKESA